MKKITAVRRFKLGIVTQLTLLLLWLPIAAYSEATGEGPTFSNPEDIAIDSINNRVLVVDSTLNTLFSVNLTSGDRTVISSLTTGTGEGPQFNSPTEVALDSAQNRALVIEGGLESTLISVALANGNRTVISNTTTGTGPKFYSTKGLALDSLNNCALVTAFVPWFDTLSAVDLTNGNRAVISSKDTGSGPGFEPGFILKDVALDSLNNRALVIAGGLESTLISVDLANGNRTVISHKLVGVGPEIKGPQAIALDHDNNRVLVLGWGYLNPDTLVNLGGRPFTPFALALAIPSV